MQCQILKIIYGILYRYLLSLLILSPEMDVLRWVRLRRNNFDRLCSRKPRENEGNPRKCKLNIPKISWRLRRRHGFRRIIYHNVYEHSYFKIVSCDCK
jgi:hypothetical protein